MRSGESNATRACQGKSPDFTAGGANFKAPITWRPFSFMKVVSDKPIARSFHYDGPARGHIKNGWNTTAMLIRGRLTDKKIEHYRKHGWYSQQFKDARRELMQKKRSRRSGAFLEHEGRLIYSPQ